MKTYGPQRLKYIPHESRRGFIKPNPGALIGALIFIGAIVLPDYVGWGNLFGSRMVWIWIAVGGLLFGMFSLAYQARKNRRNWIRIRARCLDHEVFQDSSNDGDTGRVWDFIMLCEYELKGELYRVTPAYWCSFPTQGSVLRFIGKKLSPEGTCEIYVNPDNPLQAEIVGHDIKDVLLH